MLIIDNAARMSLRVHLHVPLCLGVYVCMSVFSLRLRLYFVSGRAQDQQNRRQDRFSKQSLDFPQRAGDARPKRPHSAFGFQADKRPRQQPQQQSQQQSAARAQRPKE